MPCAMCGGRGYVMNPPGWILGRKIPCPSCNPGGARGAFPAPARVQAAPPASEPWTPAQTAQVLKATLYIVVGLTLYGLYHLGIRAESEETNVLEPDTSAPNGDDYFPWEPEQ
jgi:hypothetical protein